MNDKQTVVIHMDLWRQYLVAALLGFWLACSVLVPTYLLNREATRDTQKVVELLRAVLENCYGRWVVWTSVDQPRDVNVQCNEDDKESKERVRQARRQTEVGQGGPIVSKPQQPEGTR